MKRISFLVALALMLSCTAGVYAGSINDQIEISVTIAEHPTPDWGIAIKDADYPSGADITTLDTNGVQMHAMGAREVVLGKIFLQVKTYDIYEVVVYSNEMDNDSNPANDYKLPWNWGAKNDLQKEDFIGKHSGLQNTNLNYRDNEGFALLYGAALKVRSEGIHGNAAADGPIPYDADNDGTNDSTTTLMKNATIPDVLWNAKLYPNQVCFSPVPELAVEKVLGGDLVKVAGSIYASPLLTLTGDPNWLEVIFGASEEGTGSDPHATTVYFDLRWN